MKIGVISKNFREGRIIYSTVILLWLVKSMKMVDEAWEPLKLRITGFLFIFGIIFCMFFGHQIEL